MPDALRRSGFLALLLEAYALVDASVVRAVGETKTACSAGCSVCCHQPIPVTPPEILGLCLFIKSSVPELMAKALQGHRRNLEGSSDCLFLHENICTVYKVRPIACRRLIIKGEPCAQGVDAVLSRLSDVIEPDRKSLMDALLATLPYYEQHGPHLPPNPQFSDFVAVTKVMGSLNWIELLKK